jgi:putative addiction module CopG family antidote
MPCKHNLNVSVTEHLARFVADQTASGRFSSASEVVRAGLRLLERDLTAAPVPARTEHATDAPRAPSGLARPSGPKGRTP